MTGTDVLVVGGGPAGAALATLLSRSGVRVVVLEKDSFPRDKVCGEFVSAEGCAVLRRLGVLERLVALGGPRLDRFLVSAPSGRSVEFPLPDIPGIGRSALGITRSRMDRELLELAAAAGTDVRERTEAVAPIVEDGRVLGVRARTVGSAPGSETTLFAPVVVAADGRRSVLQRALSPSSGDPTRTGPGAWFGLKRHFRSPSREVRERVELHLFDGGYAGLGPVEDGLVNLCFLTTVEALRACGGSADRILRERILRNPGARASLTGAVPDGDWRAVGPLRFGPRRPVLGGAILLGDAAGPVDPFAGEGMSNALTGAELAAGIVLAAVGQGGVDEILARRWERAWRETFAGGLSRVRRLGRLFERPALGRIALGVLSAPGGRSLLARVVRSTRTAAAAHRQGLT